MVFAFPGTEFQIHLSGCERNPGRDLLHRFGDVLNAEDASSSPLNTANTPLLRGESTLKTVGNTCFYGNKAVQLTALRFVDPVDLKQIGFARCKP